MLPLQWMPNPSAAEQQNDPMLAFLGAMMGWAVASDTPIALDLPRSFFILLSGLSLTEEDYRRDVDPLEWLDSLESTLAVTRSFTIPSVNPARPLISLRAHGSTVEITPENWAEFRALAVEARLHEFDSAVSRQHPDKAHH